MAGEEDINSLLIERVEILEKDVVNLKKEVADLKTEKLQVKKFSLTPADKIVTISDDDDDMDKRITTSSRSPYQRSDKEVKSCFKSSPIMDLTWEESCISAYIFNEQLDLDEDLFMIGDETGSRREFLSLATGRDINDKASIFDRVLNQPHYEMKMKYFPKNLSSWEIKNGEEIPNLWNSRNSATWVIQWLEMEDSFMSTVIGELHDETVRMKTAMKLVMHDMNKMKKEVKTQSTLMWSKLPFI
ncbi:hypothetical protein Lal_00032887 [Lupinus albus]|nr:hypothetical protein Lal_00032887 [Lupinus albus]